MEPNSSKTTDNRITFLQKPDNDNINIDVSFSSYLKRSDPPKPIIINRRLETQDAEISIFDAHKYFTEISGPQNDKKESPLRQQQIPLSRPSDASSADCSSYKSENRSYRVVGSFHAANPTACSEASWNSQTGLLSHPPGATRVAIRSRNEEKKLGFAAKWLSRRKCPCSGKKSVQIQKNSDSGSVSGSISGSGCPKKPSEPINGIHRTIVAAELKQEKVIPPTVIAGRRVFENRPVDLTGKGFSFPVLTDQKSSATMKIRAGCVEDPPRVSLDVFQPKQNRAALFPASPKWNRGDEEDDNASDASSDLFEIESFSTQTTSCGNPARRDSKEDTMTEITESCYEPSEASISWSVTTAEPVSVPSFPFRLEDPTAGGGKRRSNGNGLLMSCRCEKSVMVSETARVPKSVGPVAAGTAIRPPVIRIKN